MSAQSSGIAATSGAGGVTTAAGGCAAGVGRSTEVGDGVGAVPVAPPISMPITKATMIASSAATSPSQKIGRLASGRAS